MGTIRFFSGLRNDKSKKMSASDMFKQSLQKGTKVNTLTPEERYKNAFDDKMAAMKKELAGGSKYQYTPPGAKPQEKKISKTVQLFMQKVAEKKAKEVAKKDAQKVHIEPKYYTGMQGGRIDAKGKIYNAKNQVVLTVDVKTGKIKNKDGVTVGKYKPNSTFVDYRITGLIARSNKAPRAGGNLLWQSMDGQGGIWGASWGTQTPTSNDSPGKQGGWGGGTSGFWGGSDGGNNGGGNWW